VSTIVPANLPSSEVIMAHCSNLLFTAPPRALLFTKGLFAGFALLVAQLGTASAATLRWAPPSDALSLDPHAQNESLTNSVNAHIYERLVTRDANLALTPGLAKSWKQTSALTWQFQLRPNVKFHDGSLLTGNDVVFSVQRAQHPSSSIAQYARGLGTPVHLGNGLIEFRLENPNPVFLDHADAVQIMSLPWARAHGALAPLSLKLKQENYAKSHAMGTGPYTLVSRSPDTETVLQRFPGYWSKVPGNVETLVIIPINNAFTRTAALVNGAVDLVTAPPITDLKRLAESPALSLRKTAENRVVFLGFDQWRDELQHSNVKGKNPFKDIRVRKALAHAIDMDALKKVVLRGLAVPTGCLLPSALTCAQNPQLDQIAPKYDPSRARELLAEAGYPNGFAFTMDCPNDRNVNDEALCVAIAGMWAKVDVSMTVQPMPRAQFYPKLDRLESSAYLMAWGGAELDAQPTMDPIMHSFNEVTGRGDVNFGRFSDPELDALIQASATETNPVVRRSQVKAALLRHHEQIYHLTLYRQTLVWAMRKEVKAEPAANNHMRAWLVTVSP
jgi:peptide/nickel transport system substrate-binding protein